MDARQNSSFGFKSSVPADIVPDSDVVMEQEGAEERSAVEFSHHNNNGECPSLLPYSITLLLEYL